jgi:(2S)-methylsuccinyl-CoA dehydrogenase
MGDWKAADLTAKAEAAVAASGTLIEKAVAALRANVTENGRVSNSAMDRRQIVSYDLAQSAAEQAAARFMVEYARRVRAAKPKAGDGLVLEEHLAFLFVAEMTRDLIARLRQRLGEHGLTESDLAATVYRTEVQDLVTAMLSSDALAALGRLVRERGGDLGERFLDEDQELMRDTFRKFADHVVMPLAEHVHRADDIIPEAILSQVKEMGCFGLSIPQRYGGLQSDEHEDNMGMIVVTEELSRGSLGAAGSLITRPEILARALLAGGTQAQREKWLPALAAGDPLCAVAVTEPDYGSDVAAMKFPAWRVPGGWKMSGTKTWCTFAGKAGVMLVLARTDPDPKKGHRGLSVFLVEKPSFDGHEFEYRQPGGGVIAGKAIPTIGYRGMHSFEVFFDDVLVPDENLLGGEDGLGKGFYAIMAGFSGGRIQTAARALGVMQAAFEKALSYSSERVVFGSPIGDYELTLAKLARMGALIAVSRQFTYAVARLMDRGQGQMEASLVKFFAGKVAEWVAREAMQIHGGMGYAEETAVSRYYVDARVLSIFEGAEETLALKVIARALVTGKAE